MFSLKKVRGRLSYICIFRMYKIRVQWGFLFEEEDSQKQTKIIALSKILRKIAFVHEFQRKNWSF